MAAMIDCSDDDRAWLHRKWLTLLDASNAVSSAGAETWSFIEFQYSQPGRFYHNLSHIHAMLRQAEELKAHVADPRVMEFAIWFHDLFYDTQARDNERRSARRACQDLAAMGVDAALISAVERCILATQKHQADWFDIPDLQLFLDLDLAILGASTDTYRKYSEAIRQEYGWVLDAAYRFGRRRVLEGFVKRPKVFFTTLMAERFDEQARRNIEWELALLDAAGA